MNRRRTDDPAVLIETRHALTRRQNHLVSSGPKPLPPVKKAVSRARARARIHGRLQRIYLVLLAYPGCSVSDAFIWQYPRWHVLAILPEILISERPPCLHLKKPIPSGHILSRICMRSALCASSARRSRIVRMPSSSARRRYVLSREAELNWSHRVTTTCRRREDAPCRVVSRPNGLALSQQG